MVFSPAWAATGLNLTAETAEMGALKGVEILGTPLDAIYKGEDREKFRDLMNEIGEPVPESMVINTLSQIDEAIAKIGLPAVVRPAYTLGGAGGGIGRTREELTRIVELGLSPVPYSPGTHRAECDGLERTGVRGDEGFDRYLYYRLQHGKCRSDGDPYRGERGCCAHPDAPR